MIMKSTEVQTLGTGHAIVHTEHLVGSEELDIIINFNLSLHFVFS